MYALYAHPALPLIQLIQLPLIQLQEQVGPLKVRVIVTNGVSSLEKCTLDRRSEEIG